MFRLIRRFFSGIVVLALVALILNLKVGGRPSRELAHEIWMSEAVQSVYRVVRDRFLALLHRDISVEDVFKVELPSNQQGKTDQKNPSLPAVSEKSEGQGKKRVVDLDKLSEEDKQQLERILDKSSQK